MIVIIGSIILGLMIILYILLACGLPLGFLVMGGKSKKELTSKERKQVLIIIPAQLFALYVLLSLGNVFSSSPGTLVIFVGHIYLVYFLVSIRINLKSKSKYEKVIMTLFSLFLAFSYLYVLYL